MDSQMVWWSTWWFERIRACLVWLEVFASHLSNSRIWLALSDSDNVLQILPTCTSWLQQEHFWVVDNMVGVHSYSEWRSSETVHDLIGNMYWIHIAWALWFIEVCRLILGTCQSTLLPRATYVGIGSCACQVNPRMHDSLRPWACTSIMCWYCSLTTCPCEGCVDLCCCLKCNKTIFVRFGTTTKHKLSQVRAVSCIRSW